MRSLTDEQRENFSDELRLEILSDYGQFLETHQSMYALEPDLPWDRKDILWALCCTLLPEKPTTQQSTAFHAIFFLDDVIPSPEQYEERLRLSKLVGAAERAARESRNYEDFVDKMNKYLNTKARG